MPKDHLLTKCFNINYPIDALSEKPHTVILNILPTMQVVKVYVKNQMFWRMCYIFFMQNDISYLPLHSGINLVCVSAS